MYLLYLYFTRRKRNYVSKIHHCTTSNQLCFPSSRTTLNCSTFRWSQLVQCLSRTTKPILTRKCKTTLQTLTAAVCCDSGTEVSTVDKIILAPTEGKRITPQNSASSAPLSMIFHAVITCLLCSSRWEMKIFTFHRAVYRCDVTRSTVTPVFSPHPLKGTPGWSRIE